MASNDESLAQKWYEEESRRMEMSLGTEHSTVLHAIVPYAVGGPLDLPYYPHALAGTAIATKELSELPNAGSSNDEYQAYELVMFYATHPE